MIDDFIIKKHSILKSLGVFILVTVCIFITMISFILKPKVETLFDEVFKLIEQNVTKAYAGQLELYLHGRELAVRDIARSAIAVNAVMVASFENSQFKDYINGLSILGEEASFALINALGEVIYQEGDFKYHQNKPSQLALLEGDAKSKSLHIYDSQTPMFELAVPITYGGNVEGVLVAQFLVAYDQMMPEQFKSEHPIAMIISDGRLTLRYGEYKNDNYAKEDLNTIKVERYGLTLGVMEDHSLYKIYTREILLSFSYSIVLGSILMLIVLFLVGKKLIVHPFSALQKSKKIIESAVGGIALLDTNFKYTALNDAFAYSLKYKKSHFIGKEIEFFVNADEQLKLDCVKHLKANQASSGYELKCMAGDGSVVFLQLTVLAQYNKKAECSGYVMFSQDITRQKEYEIKLLSQQQELKLIFDNVPVSIWYKDDKNKMIRLNETAAQTMGGSVEDFEGGNAYDLFPQMAKKYHDDDLEVINANKAKLNIIERYTPLNGEHKWVKTDKIPYQNPITQERFIFVCAQDITLIKTAEEEKSQLINILSEKNKDLEQFAFIASHDLKAPLRGIEQTASWVLEDCDELLPGQSKEHLAMMMRRVKRMGRLLDDLLEYSRTEKIDNALQPVNIQVQLEELIDLHLTPFGFTCNLMGMPSENTLLPKIPFEIVIRNILSNAVKHHHKGKGLISITYEQRDNKNVLNITDDGPGIASNMHEKAFQMFQTLKSRDITEGSGMGLAIIKRLLMRDGGSVRIISDGVSGCTFSVEWPFIKEEKTHE